jgi:hypothetical protein
MGSKHLQLKFAEAFENLDLSELLDDFILGYYRILHDFERNQLPSDFVLSLQNESITAFADDAMNSVVIHYSVTKRLRQSILFPQNWF